MSPAPPPAPRRNWPLVAGGAIVAAALLLAVAGPALAPRDPLAQETLFRIGGRFYQAPVPPFLTWDFPLGTDVVGRDLLSALLWGIGPTMALVLLAAGLRLALGLLIGLAAGWSRGPLGLACGALIELAAALPVLLVALGVIALVGVERGLPAFLAGLVLTGWTETARVAQGQARLLRGRPFIQAAVALGGSELHILVRHLLRHVLPLAGMLLAFEAGAVLMLVGSLAVLRYYIGGGTQVQVDDGVVRTVVGVPELGQLLATSLARLHQPWQMLLVGTLIFVIVLGFNLLGEGLRRAAQREARTTPAARALGRALGAIEERALAWAAHLGPRHAVVLLGAPTLLAAAWLSWGWQRAAEEARAVSLAATATASVPTPTPPPGALDVPGGHPWASVGRDPRGSRLATELPAAPELLWEARPARGRLLGPAVAADGTLYLTVQGGPLLALGPDGSPRWQGEVPGGAVGGPALGPGGEIAVVGGDGGLTSFGADGTVRWRLPSPGRAGSSGPTVGPDGAIYYAALDSVRAVGPDGAERWIAFAQDAYLEQPPLLSPDGTAVYIANVALRAADGRPLPGSPVVEEGQFAESGRLLVGLDRRSYYQGASELYRWRQGDVIGGLSAPVWLGALYGFSEAGVLPDRRIWSLHAPDGMPESLLVWRTPEGTVLEETGGLPAEARLVAVTGEGTALLCGRGGGRTSCVAVAQRPRAELLIPGCAPAPPTPREPGRSCRQFEGHLPAEPRWSARLPTSRAVVGGAVAFGRLYLVTEDGGLYALGDRAAR